MRGNWKPGSLNLQGADEIEDGEDILQEDAPGGEDVEDTADEVDDD